jgi:choline dehydrogenase-like flavoprotein
MKGRVTQGAEISADIEETCDVCVIGSGAGGAVLAAGLVEAGLDVVMLEAGGYFTRRDFTLNQGQAFPDFYQDRGGRGTDDLAIAILQGRTVGGSTTVNWTTCFRTPERILERWRSEHGVEGLDAAELAPHFDFIEKRLNISAWPESLANNNNKALLEGARALGWEAGALKRNVRGCGNSGYCGEGCPLDAKQAMHVTFLPDAIYGGMRLYADVEAQTLELSGGRVSAVKARVLQRGAAGETGYSVTVRPKVVALSGGAINSPALLLRSGLDPSGRTGRRTFLHPVIAVVGRYEHAINPFFGAPQSVGSHHFIDRGDDEVGFFLEAAPTQPMLGSTATTSFGDELQEFMGALPHISSLIALHVDGLAPGDDGGRVTLRSDGRPSLAYPVSRRLARAMRASHEVLARIHLAAGALEAATLHHSPLRMTGEVDLKGLDKRSYGAHQHSIFSAHQMGGCAMGADPSRSVVGPDHRHHAAPNLFVVDGSVLPTALGVNPSETVYALAHRARAFVAGAV